MSVWRFLGESHFEPTEIAVIAHADFPPDLRWFRRRWRWRTAALALAFVAGLAAGTLFSSATAAAPPGAVAIPPGPSGSRAEAETAAPRRAALGTSMALPSARPPLPAPTVSPPPSARVTWQYDPEVSFYGPGFYGRRTACGLALTTALIGVAHRSLPCGTLVEFRWRGRVVRAPVVDRGPYVAGRQWDLTGGLCLALEHCWTGPIEWRLVP